MEEKSIDILKKYSVSDVEITKDSIFLNDLGISSLGTFYIVCELEEAYNKKIDIMGLINVKKWGNSMEFSKNSLFSIWVVLKNQFGTPILVRS